MLETASEGFDVVEFADVDGKKACVGRAVVDVTESGVPDDLVRLVRRSGMYRL
jgi:hypothetical protein